MRVLESPSNFGWLGRSSHIRAPAPGQKAAVAMESIVTIVVVVLIVLFVLGYFGRGRFRA